MADREHPKTHVENDKKAKLPRTQPLSPQDEGIDPLTEGDTMYPRENTQEESAKVAADREDESADENESDEKVEETVADQKAVEKSEDNAAEKKANTKSVESNASKTDESAKTDTPKSGTSESKTSSR